MQRGNDMLPKFYRFRCLWTADQTLTFDNAARVNLRANPWKFGSGGALEYDTVITDDFDFGAGETIVTTGQVESAVINNSSNLYLGLHGFLEVIADVSGTDGTMKLYVEWSDADANWISDEADFDILDMRLLRVLTMSTNAVDEGRAVNFTFGG